MLKITYLDSVDSTQIYLKSHLKDKSLKPPCAVSAEVQTSGIGSRDNSWIGCKGNLFLSFAIKLSQMPKDLKLESASIYYAYLLKEVLKDYGSKVWLKWPNDFYIEKSKIGGMITHIVGDIMVCGVGLNLVSSPDGFKKLDIEVIKSDLLEKYFDYLQKKPLWKKVFSKYKLEFDLSRDFQTHSYKDKVSLKDASLNDDGSIMIDDERIYSLR